MPWELLGGALAGLAALVTAVAGVAKVVDEIRQSRVESKRTRDSVARIEEQFRNNHGSSARDSMDRSENMLKELGSEFRNLRDDVSDIKASVKRHDSEFQRTHNTLLELSVRATKHEQQVHDRLEDHSERLRDIEHPQS